MSYDYGRSETLFWNQRGESEIEYNKGFEIVGNIDVRCLHHFEAIVV